MDESPTYKRARGVQCIIRCVAAQGMVVLRGDEALSKMFRVTEINPLTGVQGDRLIFTTTVNNHTPAWSYSARFLKPYPYLVPQQEGAEYEYREPQSGGPVPVLATRPDMHQFGPHAGGGVHGIVQPRSRTGQEY